MAKVGIQGILSVKDLLTNKSDYILFSRPDLGLPLAFLSFLSLSLLYAATAMVPCWTVLAFALSILQEYFFFFIFPSIPLSFPSGPSSSFITLSSHAFLDILPGSSSGAGLVFYMFTQSSTLTNLLPPSLLGRYSLSTVTSGCSAHYIDVAFLVLQSMFGRSNFF